MSNATGPLASLLRRFELETQGEDCFVGASGSGEGTLFGGFVASQATVAAGRTVSAERRLHSLHGYFLRPGRHNVPITYRVERVREGRTFSTRLVVARQIDEPIFTLTADFTRTESGLEHQVSTLPEVPPPGGLPDWEDVRAQLLGQGTPRRKDGPIEVRMCDTESPEPGVRLSPYRRVWMRPRGAVPDDPLLHAALFVYASDRTLLRTAARVHGLGWKLGVGASLDHAVWLHRPARFDDWILFASESPVAHAGRPLLLGAMYQQDGTRIVSVVQEGLIRAPTR